MSLRKRCMKWWCALCSEERSKMYFWGSPPSWYRKHTEGFEAALLPSLYSLVKLRHNFPQGLCKSGLFMQLLTRQYLWENLQWQKEIPSGKSTETVQKLLPFTGANFCCLVVRFIWDHVEIIINNLFLSHTEWIFSKLGCETC